MSCEDKLYSAIQNINTANQSIMPNKNSKNKSLGPKTDKKGRISKNHPKNKNKHSYKLASKQRC